MADGFRIERISIEGFKGFTRTQEIDLKNRHVFLLGPNGKGKSSIIEAIRWGLFGSTGRRNDVVRNASYGGDCRVVINLSRNGRAWRLSRVLLPGSGESRPELLDDSDQVQRIGDVLPQIDSLDAGEGTHIIFAAQSAPLGRPPEDLSPFEKTVIGHLGLTDASALMSHLETFAREQEEEENRLTSLVDDRRGKLTDRISELERQRGLILAAPPWDGELQPSIAETERKAKELIAEIVPAQSDEEVGTLGLDALVDKTERALDERLQLDQTPLVEELERLDRKLADLETISGSLADIGSNREKLGNEEEALKQILSGTSIDELRAREESLLRSAGALALERRLGEVAAELLERKWDTGSTPCPICGTSHERNDLSNLVSALSQADGEEDLSDLRATEDQLKAAQEADRHVQQLRKEIEAFEDDLKRAVASADDGKLAVAVKSGDVGGYIESVRQQKASTKAQIDGFEDWLNGIRAKVSKLREEARFQQLQQDVRALKAVDEEMQRAERSFEHFVQFGESVRHIRDTVRSTLTQELRKKVPSVGNELTAVFRALTQHDYFDQLLIDKEKLPKLELLVASSSDPSGTLHPTGVLNGQAASALTLVPHFALSQAHEAPTEVYLVLLDDPTRAFDREHIQILIERLADLGERVQIVVATQETETFRELLPRSFQRETYVVVEPQDWSASDGPRLIVE